MRKKDAFEEQFSGDFISFHSFLGFRFGKNVKMTINSLENVIRIHKLNKITSAVIAIQSIDSFLLLLLLLVFNVTCEGWKLNLSKLLLLYDLCNLKELEGSFFITKFRNLWMMNFNWNLGFLKRVCFDFILAPVCDMRCWLAEGWR